MVEPMPASELDAIRARRNAATEGPWWFDESEDCWRLHGVGHRFPPQVDGKIPGQIVNKQILKAPKQGTPYAEYWPDAGDAPFIVNAWKDMGALLAEVKRLNGVVEKEERDSDQVLKERDDYHDLLDRFAYSVAPVEVIGEHSSANDPWANALEIVTPAAEVDRITSACMAAELERDVRLTAGDVERFLKRERDEHGKESYWWRSLDEALDAFRLHMVTGTPLTEPRPHGGPEPLGAGPEPLTEAEELRAEVERLTAELAESRRGEHCALTDYALARARADKAETERDKLRVELDTAKAVMSRALGEVEHEEVVYLLHRYLDVYPATTPVFPATTREGE